MSSVGALTPPLKWAGGKRWLVPWLQQVYAPLSERRLVEPFVGGLAVSLGVRPRDALLNDANVHVVNLYRQIQGGLRCRLPMRNERDLYYAHRAAFNASVARGRTDTARAAELFYYLNRTGFNGLCRFNGRGEFNVPFGRHSTITYVRDFTSYRETLSAWMFQAGDFSALQVRPGDVVYADPPYDATFTRYSTEDFRWPDQVRLGQWLADHDGPVIASNLATDRILDLYSSHGFAITTVQAPRRISRTGDRRPAAEMIAVRGVELPT